MNQIENLAPASGVTMDGVNDNMAPRSTENVVEKPATVAMPRPLGMNILGHGTLHGNMTESRDSLAEFLSRPVRIGSIDTSLGSFAVHEPWVLFLNNPLVAEKLKAFGFIRGTLHLRFVMSVSQFVQGRVFVAYNPAGAQDDAVFGRGLTLKNISHLPFSGYMDPGIGNDLEWSIPYHDAQPYFPTEDGVSQLGGTLHSRTMVPFENSSTGTPSGTIIQLVAWMTDVELRVAAIPQSGYSTSRALDLATKGLTHLKALTGAVSASAAAHAVGDALAAFGYTREADTRDLMPVRLRTNAAWAITEGAEQSYPLTADPHAEKTLATDYSVGISQDELLISYMAGRYSYVGPIDWTSSSSGRIGNWAISPVEHANTCLDACSMPFSYWRGSIKYKLSAVRTPFHKGKLLVKWAPLEDRNDSSLNTGYSVIWDLDSTPEIEILLPWNRGDLWARITPFAQNTVPYSDANGYLSVYVLEGLTGPADSTSVPIAVYVAGGPDIAFSCPTGDNLAVLGFGDDNLSGSWTPAAGPIPFPAKGVTTALQPDPVFPQAGVEDFSSSSNMFVLGPVNPCPDAALRSMSEQCVSFRELLKRKVRAYTFTQDANTLEFVPTYPKSYVGVYGWIDNDSTALMNSPYQPNLMSYLMAMFYGVSGTTKWDIWSTAAASYFTVARGFGHVGVNYSSPTSGVMNGTQNGATISRQDLDGLCSYVAPHYIRQQFSYISNIYQDSYLEGTTLSPTTFTEFKDNGVFVLNSNNSSTCNALVAAGDDFNLIYYLGPPPYAPVQP